MDNEKILDDAFDEEEDDGFISSETLAIADAVLRRRVAEEQLEKEREERAKVTPEMLLDDLGYCETQAEQSLLYRWLKLKEAVESGKDKTSMTVSQLRRYQSGISQVKQLEEFEREHANEIKSWLQKREARRGEKRAEELEILRGLSPLSESISEYREQKKQL